MIPIFSLLLILYISLFITKIATIFLMHTGLSRQEAKLQARSAFSGCGYTTSESEKMVRHPFRRKILMLLILFGNIGLVTAMSSLLLGLFKLSQSTDDLYDIIIVLVVGLALLWYITSSKWVDRRLAIIVEWGLRRYSALDVKDYIHLFHLADGYKIAEFDVSENKWLINKSLHELKLREEGLLILGISRKDGTYIGVPQGRTKIHEGDSLIIYGRNDVIDQLHKRPSGKKGDEIHVKATKEHKDFLKDQEKIV